jgi:NADPH:quinone reductase-like Zn-dependent oxidoreductase
MFAVQFARWKGAHVVATASTANVELVRSLGAETVIDYTVTPFERVAQDMDLVLDTQGGDVLQRSLEVVRPGGTVVSLLEQPSQAQARARGIYAMKNTVTQPFPSTQLLDAIAQLLESGQIRTIIGETFSSQEARKAHKLGQTGHGRGRIVLHISE